MKITPPRGRIGAEIRDLDLLRITDAEVAAVKDLAYRHKLVVLRGVRLDDDQYLTMARRFGRPQV